MAQNLGMCSAILINTHTRLTALFPGLPGWAGTRKVKPIWILLEQEPASVSGISWAICKSAPHSRQITTPAPGHRSVFYRPDALPAAQPTASKHWRPNNNQTHWISCKHRRQIHHDAAKMIQHAVEITTWWLDCYVDAPTCHTHVKAAWVFNVFNYDGAIQCCLKTGLYWGVWLPCW